MQTQRFVQRVKAFYAISTGVLIMEYIGDDEQDRRTTFSESAWEIDYHGWSKCGVLIERDLVVHAVRFL